MFNPCKKPSGTKRRMLPTFVTRNFSRILPERSHQVETPSSTEDLLPPTIFPVAASSNEPCTTEDAPTSPRSTRTARDSYADDQASKDPKDLALRLRRLSSPRWFSGHFPPSRTIRPVTPPPRSPSPSLPPSLPRTPYPSINAHTPQDLPDPFTDFPRDATAALDCMSDLPPLPPPPPRRASNASTLSSSASRSSSYVSSVELNHQMQQHRRHGNFFRRTFLEPYVSAPTIPRRFTDPVRGPCWWKHRQRRRWMREQAWTRVVLDEWDAEEGAYCGRVVLRQWRDVRASRGSECACQGAEDGEDEDGDGDEVEGGHGKEDKRKKKKQKLKKKKGKGRWACVAQAASAMPLHARPFTLHR